MARQRGGIVGVNNKKDGNAPVGKCSKKRPRQLLH